MYAIIATGGKQYKVSEGDVLKVEKLNAAEGDTVTFDQVIAVSDNGLKLTGENFEWFDVESNTMCPLEGTYELLYGGTSDRNKLKTIVMNVQ